ncbi:DNA sulfur modification protein DndB [Microcoleus sp. FACHB-831]|uniref:DNA sulfur modification protein DndB n=1 Tax=Microcoleus sp. FACHB-831 TaxID=2692827 RepID=UPI001689B237|nr:DNA sulfur modification protein DndB [Microcoleus sp. FACHB-831]MBD1919660.1 DNA sulfur modification protein DndB [Microcoleus sp. FACHB-831]
MDETNKSRYPLDGLLDPYFSKYYRKAGCYPGLIFQQGMRTMLQINIPARELITFLQATPSTANDPNSGKNRPIHKPHVEQIKKYVLERARAGKPWILGTITANVDPKLIEVIDLGRGICLVVIPNDVSLDITDGQHRHSAIDDLARGSEKHLILDAEFPITLVLDGNERQCKTDFRDMAQTEPLPKSLLVSFGVVGCDWITQELIERVPMFPGKTHKIKASPGADFIYTSKYVAKAVSCAFTNEPSAELLEYDIESSVGALTECFNQFFSECSHTKYIFEKEAKELKPDEISAFKDNCVLGLSVGLEILGKLLYWAYDKDKNYFDTEKVSKIAQLDWTRESALWRNNIVRVDPNPRNPANPYKISAVASAVRTAVNAARDELAFM